MLCGEGVAPSTDFGGRGAAGGIALWGACSDAMTMAESSAVRDTTRAAAIFMRPSLSDGVRSALASSRGSGLSLRLPAPRRGQTRPSGRRVRAVGIELQQAGPAVRRIHRRPHRAGGRAVPVEMPVFEIDAGHAARLRREAH